MRYAALLALLIPTLSHGLGVEDTYLYGLRHGGALVALEFKSASMARSDRPLVYGTRSSGRLAFCWPTSGHGVRAGLFCSAGARAAPSVVYRALPVPATGAHPPVRHPYGAEYRRISKLAGLGTGDNRGDGTVLSVYVCETGCSTDVPLRLYEVGRYD